MTSQASPSGPRTDLRLGSRYMPRGVGRHPGIASTEVRIAQPTPTIHLPTGLVRPGNSQNCCCVLRWNRTVAPTAKAAAKDHLGASSAPTSLGPVESPGAIHCHCAYYCRGAN